MQRTIDIHSHVLYGVDDGAKTISESLDMLQEAADQGITDMILTPHYHKEIFPYPVDRVLKHFLRLKKESHNIGVQLHLGCECRVSDTLAMDLRSNRCSSLNFGEYVLTEFSDSVSYDGICRYIQELIQSGYTPILAHIERYECLRKNPDLVEDLSELGAMVQLNADSILGMLGRPVKQFCHKVLKEELADFVASDAHDCKDRPNRLGKCRKHVEKKYGVSYARKLFCTNAEHILDKK